MVTRAEIVSEARTWLEVPWRHQGRDITGVDCVGLVVMVCRALGISDYDSTSYGRSPDARQFLGHFTAGGATRINPLEAGDGDLMVFHQSGFPCHCGILSTRFGERYVIHSHMGRRKVVEEHVRPESPVVACYRLPGVDD